jgi:hypothetical protein
VEATLVTEQQLTPVVETTLVVEEISEPALVDKKAEEPERQEEATSSINSAEDIARETTPEEVETSSAQPEEHKYDQASQLSKEEAANLTLKQLQTLCLDHNLVARGTKADLRQRLQQAHVLI